MFHGRIRRRRPVTLPEPCRARGIRNHTVVVRNVIFRRTDPVAGIGARQRLRRTGLTVAVEPTRYGVPEEHDQRPTRQRGTGTRRRQRKVFEGLHPEIV